MPYYLYAERQSMLLNASMILLKRPKRETNDNFQNIAIKTIRVQVYVRIYS